MNKSLGILPFAPASDEHLEISALETWLWNAACEIRGATDAPKYKDFILPLIFYKRLSDVFDDEFAGQIERFGDEERARAAIEEDRKNALKSKRRSIVRFYIPRDYGWEAIRDHPADGGLGEFVTAAMRETARLNPELDGVLNIKDYNERQGGQRALDDDRLSALIEVVSRHRLGLKNAEPDILGRAYEYLLRKFAEDQGQSAGEFYTPKEVGWLMAELLNPAPGKTIYDPACGSAGLLIKARLVFGRRHPGAAAPKLYGQELNPTTFAMAKINMFLHDFSESCFAIGDTFTKPGFVDEGARLMRFDYVTANVMWNQDNYGDEFYETDRWGRFNFGFPPKSSADWGWVEHIFASLKDDGRAAVVLDTGAVSRGSGSRTSNRERAIRREFVERDYIEGVILLPENLFYNTTAPGIILLLNRRKPSGREGEIVLVNLSAYFAKERTKNILAEEGIKAACEVYERWEAREKLSRIVTLDEVRAADYNLSPPQFIEVNEKIEHRPLGEILADLKEARAERESAEAALNEVLAKLGLNG